MREEGQMDLERFRQIVEAYGAAPDRWPENEREAALALLASSNEAALLLEQETALDRGMDAVSRNRPSDDLVARVLESAAVHLPKQAARRSENAGRRSLWTRWKGSVSRWAGSVGSDVDQIDWKLRALSRPLAALGCAALLGIAVGVSAPIALEFTSVGEEEEIMLMALTPPQIELEAFVLEGEDG